MRSSLLVAWVLRGIVLVAFLYFGLMHLIDPGYAAQFVVWGYPHGWHVVTAVLEFVGAALILIPTATLIGVGLLGLILLTAIGTLLMQGNIVDALIPLIFLGAVVTLGWLRWSERV